MIFFDNFLKYVINQLKVQLKLQELNKYADNHMFDYLLFGEKQKTQFQSQLIKHKRYQKALIYISFTIKCQAESCFK